MKHSFVLSAFFFLFISFIAQAQQIYRWEGASGTIHYSQQPPDNSTPTNVSQTLAVATRHLSSPLSFSHGLLWKIESTTREENPPPPSYLFGTIHSEDQRVLQLPAAVREALEQSDTFCMELLPDLAATMTLTQHMLYSDGHSLIEAIGQELFDQLSPLMQQRGVPEQALTKFKPWAVYMILSTPPARTGQVLDLLLYEKAAHDGKTLCGIETAEEQVAVFEQTPLADQVTLLKELVSDPRAVDVQVQKMIPLYLQRDLAGLFAINTDEVDPSTEAFLKRLLDERNQRMFERTHPRIEKGATFIAVGALHLPGQSGLLQLLTAHGYTVSALY
jgi:uncharacterized protein YbaP (TraB family)